MPAQRSTISQLTLNKTSSQEILETHLNRKQLSGTKNMRSAQKMKEEQLYFACINYPIIQAGRIPLIPLHFHPSRDQQNWTCGYC